MDFFRLGPVAQGDRISITLTTSSSPFIDSLYRYHDVCITTSFVATDRCTVADSIPVVEFNTFLGSKTFVFTAKVAATAPYVRVRASGTDMSLPDATLYEGVAYSLFASVSRKIVLGMLPNYEIKPTGTVTVSARTAYNGLPVKDGYRLTLAIDGKQVGYKATIGGKAEFPLNLPASADGTTVQASARGWWANGGTEYLDYPNYPTISRRLSVVK